MEVWGILMYAFLFFLIMSCLGYCCTTKRRGTVLSTPVVVTSATHTGPGGYPVTQMPPPGSYQQTALYATPYPTHVGAPGQMPMPMQMPQSQMPPPGMQPHMAPYPPAPATNMNPPSYDMAVSGGPSVGQPNNASYEKQQPYNPSFTSH